MTAPFSVVNEATQVPLANFDTAGNLQLAGSLLVGSLTPLGSGGAGVLELANAATAPTHTTPGGLVVYAAGGGLVYASAGGQINKVFGSQGPTPTVTVANSNTETVLQTLTVPGGDIPAAGAVFHSVAYGSYSWTATPTLQFISRWGGVAGGQVATQPAQTLGTAQTNTHWSVETWLTFASATTAAAGIAVSLGTSSTTDATSDTFSTRNNLLTVTSNTANDWVLTVTWGAASASNTLTLIGGYTERIA